MKAPCYAEMDDFENALKMGKQSVNHYPGWFFSWLCHAQYLAVADEKDEAREAWHEAKKRFPELNMDMYRGAIVNFSPTSKGISEKILHAVENLKVD